MQYTPITQTEFETCLEKGELKFSRRRFDFPIEVHSNFSAELYFDNCDFLEEVSFANAAFLGRFTALECNFRQDVSFVLTSFESFAYLRGNVFYGRVDLRRTIFNGNVNFSRSIFHGEAFLNHTHFSQEVSWYQTQFLNNLYVHKAHMGKRSDFSYVTFSSEHTTSFFSTEKTPAIEDAHSATPSVLIFRYVYFPKKTLFTNVDLSNSLFQDCYLVPIIFKNCLFAEAGGRKTFYQEVARHVNLSTSEEMYERIIKKIDTLTVRLDVPPRTELQIGDVVTFYNSANNREQYSVFVTWIYRAQTLEELFARLGQRLQYANFDDYKERLQDFYSTEDIAEHGVMSFSFKPFNEHRHWQNLEDINRQMKRSLEESRDWQKAGDFYVGEMRAMIKRMAVKKEKPTYRAFLKTYGWISGYCESITHIFWHMVASFSVSILILFAFRSQLSFMELFDANFKLFIPVFGNNTATLHSLGLAPWQNVVMEVQVVWYYLLWLFLALTLQRKFKR